MNIRDVNVQVAVAIKICEAAVHPFVGIAANFTKSSPFDTHK